MEAPRVGSTIREARACNLGERAQRSLLRSTVTEATVVWSGGRWSSNCSRAGSSEAYGVCHAAHRMPLAQQWKCSGIAKLSGCRVIGRRFKPHVALLPCSLRSCAPRFARTWQRTYCLRVQPKAMDNSHTCTYSCIYCYQSLRSWQASAWQTGDHGIYA